MQQHTVDLRGMEAYSRPRSRKEFFKVLGAAGLATAAGAAFATREASAQTASGVASDIEILNFAYTNESFEAEVFYPAALEAGILSGPAEAQVSQFVATEIAHRDAIAALIQSLGGTVVTPPEFFVPEGILADEVTFLQAALEQEQKDVGFNLTAGPLIQNPDVLAAAGAIAGSEGENVVAVKSLLGIVPPANEAFPQALPLDQAFAIISPFIAGAGAAAGAPTSPATGNALPSTGGPGASGNRGSMRAF